MSKYSSEAQDGCALSLAVVAIYGSIAFVLIIGALISYFVFYVPQAHNAFNAEVQGLVTEYCTAPQPDDQQAAKQQLKNLVAGRLSDFHQLPQSLQDQADGVLNDERTTVCS